MENKISNLKNIVVALESGYVPCELGQPAIREEIERVLEGIGPEAAVRCSCVLNCCGMVDQSSLVWEVPVETEEVFRTERLIFVAEMERLVALAGTDAEAHLHAQLWVFVEYMAQLRVDRAGVVQEEHMVQARVV